MAYKSRVSNKYYGSTYGGRPNVARSNELLQVVDTLKTITPSLERYSQNYIDDKKAQADATLSALYAQGKTPEIIGSEILAGKHSTLTNMYAEKVIQGHNGRFVANDAIRQINDRKDDYNPLKQTWVEWVSSLRNDDGNKIIPNMADKDSAYQMGFANTFDLYKNQEVVTDAENRAVYWNEKKQQDAIGFMDTHLMILDNVEGDYWKVLQTLNTELPAVDGKKQSFFTNEELNDVAVRHAASILATATSVDELDRAMSILKANRGTGSGGNALGSLMSTKRKDVLELVNKIETKRVSLDQINRAAEDRAEKDDIKAIFVEAMENTDKPEKRIEIREKLIPFGNPNLLDAYDDLWNKSRFVTTSSQDISNFYTDVLRGEYKSIDEFIIGFNSNNIPTGNLSTALAYFNTWETDSESGKVQIQFTSPVYTNSTQKVLSAVRGSFTDNMGVEDPNTGLAVMNADNYIFLEIADFEADTLKNEGREPTPAERQEFMTKLGKYVTETFSKTQEANTPLKSMDEISIENQEKEQEEQLFKFQNENMTKSLLDEFELDDKLPFNKQIFKKEDKSFWSHKDTEVSEFIKNKVLPPFTEYIRDNIESTIGINNLGRVLDYIPQEQYDALIDSLVTLINDNVTSYMPNRKIEITRDQILAIFAQIAEEGENG